MKGTNPLITANETKSKQQKNVLVSYDYNDVILGAMDSQITILTIVYSTVYSGAQNIKVLRHWRIRRTKGQ